MPRIKYLESQDKATCFGCSACVAACRFGAIRLKADEEGFLYPQIEQERCTECGACTRACPYGDSTLFHPAARSAYALQADCSSELNASSSGAAFALLAKNTLDEGGWVCGCSFDVGWHAYHVVSNNPRAVDAMRGSKYVQSDMGDCFREIARHLSSGDKVLFSGTPCQVAGLRAFLGKDWPRLVTVDLICHGVPSSFLLDAYLANERKSRGEVVSFKFRDKKRNGWCANGTVEWVTKSGGRKRKRTSPYDDTYYYYYLANSVSRECCYSCPYARLGRTSDLTIGDYWNADAAGLSFDCTKGTSAILVNTERGASALMALKGGMHLETASVEHIAQGNGNLTAPSPRPPLRDFIYKAIVEEGYGASAKRLCRLRPMKQLLNRLVPKHLKKIVKRFINGK